MGVRGREPLGLTGSQFSVTLISNIVVAMESPDSPCVGICTLNEKDECLGCFRTLDEIAGWEDLDCEAQRAILAELPKRGHRHDS